MWKLMKMPTLLKHVQRITSLMIVRRMLIITNVAMVQKPVVANAKPILTVNIHSWLIIIPFVAMESVDQPNATIMKNARLIKIAKLMKLVRDAVQEDAPTQPTSYFAQKMRLPSLKTLFYYQNHDLLRIPMMFFNHSLILSKNNLCLL